MITASKAAGLIVSIGACFAAWLSFTEVMVTSYTGLRTSAALDARSRGWLPIWLPGALRDVREIHDIDTNASIIVGSLPRGASVELAEVCSELAPGNEPELPLTGHSWRLGWAALEPVGQGKLMRCNDGPFVSVAPKYFIRWSYGA